MVGKEVGGCTPPSLLAFIMNIMFHFSIWFKNPKRFIFVSLRYLICSFPDISFAASKRKPTYIIETVK